MTWTCEQNELRMSDYVDRLLEPHELREFAEHLEACARCSALAARVASLVAGMQRLDTLEPPPQLVRNILDQTIGPRPERRSWRAWLDWLSPAWQPRFAMGALSVVITFAVVSQALGIQPTQISLSDLNPVNVYHQANRRAHLLYARSVKFINDLRVVYEIQSRLQPEPQPETTPAEPEAAPGKAPEKNQPRERNRADELGPQPTILASALTGTTMLPGFDFAHHTRSLR